MGGKKMENLCKTLLGGLAEQILTGGQLVIARVRWNGAGKAKKEHSKQQHQKKTGKEQWRNTLYGGAKCHQKKEHVSNFKVWWFFMFTLFFFLSFCYFFEPLPRHMEVPRLAVELEL